MKKWLAFAAALALVAVIAACGANSGGSTEVSGGAGGDLTADSSAATSEVTIVATDWEFDQDEYRIKAGETVNLTVKSVGGVHGVQILKSGYNQIRNNQTLAVKFDQPGTYDMICSIPCGNGHRSMKAKLIVE